MKNLNEHINRIKQLFNSEHGVIKPLISEDNINELKFNDLVGKTVSFKPVSFEVRQLKDGEVFPSETDDEWFEDDLKTLVGQDKRAYDEIMSTNLNGKITNVRTLGDIIVFGMEQIQNGHPMIKDNYDPLTKKYGSNVNGVSYECGSNVFTANGLSVSGNSTSFFKNKYVIITYTNAKLKDNLESRIPCGGFDLSKNQNMDDTTIS